MTEAPEKKEKVYTRNQIILATYLGGPLIAGYILSKNFKALGNTNAAKKSLYFGIVATIVIFGGVTLVPEKIINSIPKFLIPGIYTGLAVYFFQSYQGKKIEEYLKNGYKKASFWSVLSISLLSLMATLVAVFIVATTVSFAHVALNPSYSKNYCNSSYSEKNLKKNRIYVPEDAPCFVHARLKDKGFTLQQVDQVLTLEFEYQKSIGLTDASKENDAPAETYPVPYILKHQTLGLSEAQINNILDGEDEYLKRVGIIDTNSGK